MELKGAIRNEIFIASLRNSRPNGAGRMSGALPVAKYNEGSVRCAMTSILEICPWGEEIPPCSPSCSSSSVAVVVVVVVCSISFFLMAQKKSETILFPAHS